MNKSKVNGDRQDLFSLQIVHGFWRTDTQVFFYICMELRHYYFWMLLITEGCLLKYEKITNFPLWINCGSQTNTFYLAIIFMWDRMKILARIWQQCSLILANYEEDPPLWVDEFNAVEQCNCGVAQILLMKNILQLSFKLNF